MMHEVDQKDVLNELKERIAGMVDSDNTISQWQIDNIINEIINTRELQLRQDIYVLADSFIEDQNNFERLRQVPMAADTSVEEHIAFYKMKIAEKVEA
jgi:alpha-acetolactate decarboxylase